ncbi:WYL domain-containing protein [Campylobacter gastrosuis]|uniref:WYL domain-containing protein n=1 Tax=Campylobacter gastrosuis TaxID=2974576 RepID=UPI00254B26D7|nr:WYL domain-containing protein [Campylobacter gastrosuis]
MPNAAISRREFDEISASIIKRWQISCVYNDKKRTLNPYKLINNNEIWYLLADDFGVLKNFTLSKLSEIKITQNEFSLNKEFLARIENNAQNWFSNTTFEVVLEIKSEAVPYFKRRKILPNYKIISDENTLKIISPTYLRDNFSEILRWYLKDI